MICSMDPGYECGQEAVGVVTMVIKGRLNQEKPCLGHMNEICDWMRYGEGEAVGLTDWIVEVEVTPARAELHLDYLEFQRWWQRHTAETGCTRETLTCPLHSSS